MQDTVGGLRELPAQFHERRGALHPNSSRASSLGFCPPRVTDRTVGGDSHQCVSLCFVHGVPVQNTLTTHVLPSDSYSSFQRLLSHAGLREAQGLVGHTATSPSRPRGPLHQPPGRSVWGQGLLGRPFPCPALGSWGAGSVQPAPLGLSPPSTPEAQARGAPELLPLPKQTAAPSPTGEEKQAGFQASRC